MATQIRLADGGYLETYTGSDERLHVQKYTAGGTPVGADHVFYNDSPEIAALSDGGFVVTRTSYAFGLYTEAYVFSAASTQLARFETPGAKLLASPEGGFALASTQTEYRGDGDGPDTFVTLYSNAGVKVFQEGPFLGDRSNLTVLENGDYRFMGVTIDPSNPRDTPNPSNPTLTIVDDVEPQGAMVNDPTPTMRVTVAEEGRLQYSNSLYHSDPYYSTVVTAEDVARGYVDVPVNGRDGTYNYRVRMIDNEGLVSSYVGTSYTVDTTAAGAPVVARVMDNQDPVQGEVAAGGATDDLSPTLHLTTPGAKAGDQIQLYQDGKAFGAPVALTVGDIDRGYVAITPSVISGAYSFSGKMTDQAGNAGPMGGTFSFNVQSQQQQTTLSIGGGGSMPEGDDGSTAFTFTVTRSGDLSLSTAVDYFLLGDPTDFTGQTSSTLSFAPGEQTKAIQILVQGDTAVEADETFEVGLSNARGAVIGTQKATGVIQNDDGTQPPADATPSIQGVGLSLDEQSLATGASGSVVDTDTIKLTAADGVDDFKVEGRSVITDGVFSPVSFQTPVGVTLAFTAYDAATQTLSVSYSLQAGVDHSNAPTSVPNVRERVDRLTLELTDRDGDYARQNLHGVVYDGAPRAQNDSDVAVVGGSAATGNVITDAAPGDAGDGDAGADQAGADTPLRVSAVRSGPVEDTTPNMLDDFVSTGRFGTLTINANGNYSYVLHSNPEDGVTDSFGYTVRDADGSQVGASLSIQVQGGQNARGQILVADQPGDTLAGGSGADTLYASQGPDQLSGGAGADLFAFEALPWNAGRITDFAVGSDRLDLSAIFQSSGYTAPDPVADGRMRFESDGAGGTEVYFDRDAPNTGDWPFLITTLENVNPTGLTWAQLSGGGTQPPPANGSTVSIATETVSAGEGNSGEQLFRFAVTRSGDSSGQAGVNWSVAGGSGDPAEASDFVGGAMPSGTLTFAPGETLGHVEVRVAADLVHEHTESFKIQLGGATGATLGASSAEGRIINDDTVTVGYSSGSPSPVEGDAGLQPRASYAVSVLGSTETTITLDWGVGFTGANPADDADFGGSFPAGTVTLVPGDKQEDIVLQIAGDTVVEPDEGFYVALAPSPIQGVTLSYARYDAVIRNDDSGGSTPPASGQVIDSPGPGSTLQGGAGADTLNASQGPDQLTGAAGADRFVFAKPPWNAGVVTDFAAGSDKIDVSALLDAYGGSNPVADGWLRLDEVDGSTRVYVDIDGAGGEWPFLITTLQGVAPSAVSLSDFIV